MEKLLRLGKVGECQVTKLQGTQDVCVGGHRNEEAAHSNLISFHQHLVDQTITLEICSTFKLTFISHYIRK